MLARLRDLAPTGWQIRYRLLAAGIILTVLGFLTPGYMRARLVALSETYNWTASNWDVLDKAHRLSRLLSDSESKLRAYAVSGNREWLDTIRKNTTEMDSILPDLWKVAMSNPRRTALLEAIASVYRQWLDDVAAKYSKGGQTASSNELPRVLATEAISIRLHGFLDGLARDIRENNVAANDAVLSTSRNALRVLIYGGGFFFIGFAALMFSLWFTLIPDLNALLGASQELKKGNLDHRVELRGASETARLGRAFNEMAASLQAQNEKLKELNRMKSDFVSTVSHELRTPLSAIKGSIGLILGNVTGDLSPEASRMLKITQKNTDRLIRLINEILDVSKIEAGLIQMHFDKHSLMDAINHAIAGIEAFAHTQGITLVWEPPQQSPLVVIDRDRIEQVLTNLLSNAIKFTEPGGTVAIKVNAEAHRVVIEVQDTGQGIPEEFLERIFQKFQQAEGSAHKAKEGTGLGLTIAKAIVEDHRGSIWVNSTPGVGSIFYFSLPWNGTEFADPRKNAA